MLLLDSSVCGLFKWRQFEPEVILLAIGWYLRFSLSYRDVEELLTERGLSVDHVTIWRWVQRYAPELERRLRRHLKPTNDSWRVDETRGREEHIRPAYHGLSAKLQHFLKNIASATSGYVGRCSLRQRCDVPALHQAKSVWKIGASPLAESKQ